MVIFLYSETIDLSEDENMVYELLKEEVELSRKEIDLKAGFIEHSRRLH